MTRAALLPHLPSLSESQIHRYLVANGWIEDGSVGDVATIWHRIEEDRADAEILLPRQGQARDYQERLIDLLLAIANFEDREPDVVATAIVNLSVDVICVQVVHDDVQSGTIPLDDGVLLNMRARDLMTSAVLSAISKRRHFLGTRPPEATEYLEHLRLGQTQIGSYIVNVIAPLQTQTVEQEMLDKTSFTRMVTRNLASGLQALQDAITAFGDSKDLSVFDAAVSKGVSANMCDALLGLSGTNKARSFSILISPSALERISTDESSRYDFDPRGVATIERASEYFKDNYVLTNQVIQGYVKRLDRLPGAENGSVTITTTISDIEKNVAFELLGSDYLEAIHAHEGKLLVECKGDVHVSPRAANLLNATGFRVLRNETLF